MVFSITGSNLMIGPSILLFPDSGPHFLRTLRTTVLYSEQVRVLTLLEKDFNETTLSVANEVREKYGKDGPCGVRWPPLLQRAWEYSAFVVEHFEELRTLQNEGVMVPLTVGPTFNEVWSFRESAVEMIKRVADLAAPEEATDAPRIPWLHEAFMQCPPSFFDVQLLLAQVMGEKNKGLGINDLREEHFEGVMFHYMLTLALMAERLGYGVSTWSTAFHEALWLTRASFPPNEQCKVQMRSWTAHRLGQVVIENHVPLIDDLPIAEILALRLKRRSEIEGFRSGLA